MRCPFCDFENIEGADDCEQCRQPLDDSYLPDPASAVEQHLLSDRIGVLDPKPVIVVQSTWTVAEVLQLLVEKKIGCVVVVEEEKPVGMFSERDALLRLNTQASELGGRPVSDFMTPSPQTLQADAKIAFAVQRMDQGGYRHVPIVTDEDRLAGIISVRDILRYLTKNMAEDQS